MPAQPQNKSGLTLEHDPGMALVLHPKRGANRYVERPEAMHEAAAAQDATFAAVRASPRHPQRLCGDGDSWINILWPLSEFAGHDRTFFDVLESDFYAVSVAYPGDTFQQMRLKKDYRQLVSSGTFDFFIFSGGGNDFLGGGALTNLLKNRNEGDGAKPETHLHLPLFKTALKELEAGYIEIAEDVAAKSGTKNTRMLVHGYDVPTPKPNGPWLGLPLARKGYSLKTDKDLIKGMLTHLVDGFYGTLKSVADKCANVALVDLRGVVKTWNDELHPSTQGSRNVAKKFAASIK
jgi:hypothetical protein